MTFLVFGESLVDEVPRGDETLSLPGGSPLNVAVGLARLGRETTLVTRIGDDDAGEIIADYLADSGVRLFPGSIDDAPTSIARAHLDSAGNARYDFSLTNDYPAPPTAVTDISDLVYQAPALIHIGSIGAHLNPGADKLRSWLSIFAGTSTISYDPNVRLGVVGPREKLLAEIDELMEFVEVVKASHEDLEELFGNGDPALGARYFLDRGASLAVISMGASGLHLVTNRESVFVPAAKVDVVDTVGAGDSLMSALIDGLARMSLLGREDEAGIAGMSHSSLVSLGSYAAAAAAITVTRSGANPPTREELSKSMEMYS